MREAGLAGDTGGMSRVRSTLTAFAVLAVALALLLMQAASPHRVGSAHPALVSANDAVLATHERVAMRPPALAPDGDPAMAAHVASALATVPHARPAQPAAQFAPASGPGPRLPPARGPPGAVA